MSTSKAPSAISIAFSFRGIVAPFIGSTRCILAFQDDSHKVSKNLCMWLSQSYKKMMHLCTHSSACTNALTSQHFVALVALVAYVARVFFSQKKSQKGFLEVHE